MYFNEAPSKIPFFIKSYEAGRLLIDDVIYTKPIIIFQDQLHSNLLPLHLKDFNVTHIQALIDLAPELILLGTGVHQQFLEQALLESFTKKQMGIEIMSTLSACRTFNLLRAEGRRVLGAFFL
jgi:uncharacterized protein